MVEKRSRDRQLAFMDSVLRALADPTRLRILGLLASAEEICVCHIHDVLDCPQPTISRHLSYLRRAGLVLTRRDRQWVHYRVAPIADPVIKTLVSAVGHCVGHLDVVAKDRKKLEKACGCCTRDPDKQPVVACC